MDTEKGKQGKPVTMQPEPIEAVMNAFTLADPALLPIRRQRIIYASGILGISMSTIDRILKDKVPTDQDKEKINGTVPRRKTNDDVLANEFDVIQPEAGRVLTPSAKIILLEANHPSLKRSTIRRSLERTGRVEKKTKAERKGQKLRSIYLDSAKVSEMFRKIPLPEGKKISNRQKVLAISQQLNNAPIASVYRALYATGTLVPNPARRGKRKA